MRTLILGLVLVSLLSLGCVFQQEQNITNNTTAPPPPPPPPKVPSFSIASPSSDEVIVVAGDTGNVTLILSTQNLVLKNPGGVKKAGEGFFQVTVDEGTPVPYSTKSIELTLALGEHTVKVELMNNDRTAYAGVSPKTITFTLEKEKPKEYVPETHTVVIKDFEYQPASITVKRTDSVLFDNQGAYPRSATCFIGGKQVFDTGVLGPGQKSTIQFNETFECEYYATIYRAMTGSIKVEPNDADTQ